MIRTTTKRLILALALSTTTTAHAQSARGEWKGPGGVILVEPCAGSKSLCVVVTKGSSGKESMSDIIGQTVVKDMAPVGPGRWRGRYVADGKDLVANFTLRTPNEVEMRVCLLSWFPYLLCEAPVYTRVAR